MQILKFMIIPLAGVLISCGSQSTGIYRDQNGYTYTTSPGSIKRDLRDQNGYVYTTSYDCCHYGYYNNGNYIKGKCNEGCYNVSCCTSIWR